MSSRGAGGALVASLLVVALLAPSAAHAGDVVQVSSRLALGGGAGFPATEPVAGVFELAARVEALFGDPRPAVVRLGPALELRTATFASAELAGGLTGLVPLDLDFALTLTLGAGYAWRDQGRDGALALAVLSAAYRPYDHWDAYGLGIGIYVGGRAGFAGYDTWEITAGVEVDLELLFVTPVRYLVMSLSGSDGDQPSPGSEPAPRS